MKKNILAALLFSTVFTFSCTQRNPELKNAVDVKDRSEQKIVTGGKPSDDLRANAIPEGDIMARAKWSLGRVKEELKNSSVTVQNLGEINVLLDDNLTMVIQNVVNGEVYERRVNLANLNSDSKSMKIIADRGDNIHPGIQFSVLEGKAGVEHFKDGKLIKTERHLEFLLAERRQVQLVASAMFQAIKVSQGEL